MSGSIVYHVSSSLHLPWIVESGELRPYLNRLWGIGDVNYLWATTNKAGDKTAQAEIAKKNQELLDCSWHWGEYQLIRFTLPAAGFLTWHELKLRSKWSRAQIAELVQSDREQFGEYGQSKWRVRRRALPLSKVLAIHAKSKSRPKWHPVEVSFHPDDVLIADDDPNTKGILIDGRRYYANRFRLNAKHDIWKHLPTSLRLVTAEEIREAEEERLRDEETFRRRERQEEWEESLW